MKERLYSNPRLLDKSRAAYRWERKRDPALPPLRPDAGKVAVTDAIRVVLPTIGGKVVYTAVPVGGWRFEFEHQSYSRAAAVPAVAPSVATHDDQAKLDTDAFLDLFLGLEREQLASRRLLAGLERRLCAFEARHRLPSNNVVHLNSIAAE